MLCDIKSNDSKCLKNHARLLFKTLIRGIVIFTFPGNPMRFLKNPSNCLLFSISRWYCFLCLFHSRLWLYGLYHFPLPSLLFERYFDWSILLSTKVYCAIALRWSLITLLYSKTLMSRVFPFTFKIVVFFWVRYRSKWLIYATQFFRWRATT